MSKTLFFLACFLPSAAVAQISTETLKPANPLDLDLSGGYVVRVDSDQVYLDFGEKSGAQVGQHFIVYKEGDELLHPVTGQPLGRMEMKLAEGSLKEIHGGYSVGAVGQLFGGFGKGVRARLVPMEKAAPKTLPDASAPSVKEAPGFPGPKPAAAPGETAAREPRLRGAIVDFPVQAMAIADFNGDGKLEAALADDKQQVWLYAYPPDGSKPLAPYRIPSNSARVLSLEAADLNGNGRAELFVTSFNEAFNRAETLVLEQSGGTWTKLDELPSMVGSYQDGEGQSLLVVQQLEDDQTFPYGAIYPLVYQDGKYGPGKKSIRYPRVEWIYGFTTAKLETTEKPAPIFITGAENLRIEYKKGHWRSDESIGQTPVRLTWVGRILQRHPHMPTLYGAQGFAAIYVVKNNGSLGGLASKFGHFSSAEIERLGFNGLGLVASWRSALNGYCTALNLVALPGGGKELAAAVVGASGKSSVWIYDP